MGEQLSLFQPEKPPEQESYWKRHFNWEAKAGQRAEINIPIAFNMDQNCDRYCYMMRVNVISIENDIAICETTKDWEEACNTANNPQPENEAGTRWRVEVKHLAPPKRHSMK